MKLVVGLGNPGPEFARTRHNAGFVIVDALADRLGAEPWRYEAKFAADVTAAQLNGQKVILAKPQTYMNLSGQAVQKLVHFYKDLRLADVWVVYDEIDLPAGDVRIKTGGGDSGQKGVRSVIRHIGREFHHVRFGIGQNDRATHAAEDYVMLPLETTGEQIDRAVEMLLMAIKDSA